MTVKQQQSLLTYLGYDPVWIDGINGPKTQAALASFRADYICVVNKSTTSASPENVI